jgi:cytochrome c oxidase assembly factor CtaG
VLTALAALFLIAWLVPPLGPLARRYESVEALQFSFFAVVVPALAVSGAPWARWEPAARLADGRRRHPEALRTGVFAGLFLAGAIVWRTPLAVDALAQRPWLVVLEGATLVAVGIGLWLELVESPPLVPRLPRPGRVALAALSMWTIWILAYLVGLSHASWYHAYPHHPGSGLSLSADQQLTTGLLWLVSGCAFVPVVFWNLIRWLQAEEDPDQELHHLVRQERMRGRTAR